MASPHGKPTLEGGMVDIPVTFESWETVLKFIALSERYQARHIAVPGNSYRGNLLSSGRGVSVVERGLGFISQATSIRMGMPLCMFQPASSRLESGFSKGVLSIGFKKAMPLDNVLYMKPLHGLVVFICAVPNDFVRLFFLSPVKAPPINSNGARRPRQAAGQAAGLGSGPQHGSGQTPRCPTITPLPDNRAAARQPRRCPPTVPLPANRAAVFSTPPPIGRKSVPK